MFFMATKTDCYACFELYGRLNVRKNFRVRCEKMGIQQWRVPQHIFGPEVSNFVRLLTRTERSTPDVDIALQLSF